ncbi:NAD(P)/FAD-dependent oxidoreductase [Pusillimonas noertemannii]|uniref:NAD(P)/FAD-dependent oxidoreductase n=1 Tax=Pusillimonas noertemannii TaxID=305977 RepID=UPI000305DA8C|nr:NAD(P)/FAD-dependent oxidoreductase [Pusillimonas noertemannii]
MKNIVVVGSGFGGLWSAIGAARKLDELGVAAEEVGITVVDQNDFHSIRVRNYEEDLESTVIPLAKVLDPIGVRHVQGTVSDIDASGQAVTVDTPEGRQYLAYDRLVYALGSQLRRPSIPGLAEHSFDIDTYRAAKRLEQHLAGLPDSQRDNRDKYTVLVVGAGLTGIELASELPGRLEAIRAAHHGDEPIRVILADSNSSIGSDMGEQAMAVIEQAMAALAVETRTDVAITSVDATGATLASGERIPTPTIVWCAGMQANELGKLLPVEKDRLGRIAVDEFMRVKGLQNVFAAGDAAWSMLDDPHTTVMSCQHGRPMGRYAGHNVAADLLGKPMLPLHIDWYTTVLDLGPWGAVYTTGWDRQVIASGETAKNTKQTINCRRIYPPLSGNRAEILASAAPQVQRPPDVKLADADSQTVLGA